MSTPVSRLFVAVSVEPDRKKEMAEWFRMAKPKLPFQKWVHPDDLHVTLKFLGDTTSAVRADLEERLRSATESCEPFTLRVEGLGVFGPPSAPSILWAGIGGDVPALVALQREAEEAAEAAGFERENRAFKPHLSLARRYRGSTPFRGELLTTQEDLQPLTFTWNVRECILYESHFGHEPMYTPVCVFPFT